MKKKTDMTVSQKITELNVARVKRAKREGNFFHEMKEEMRRVSWTTKEELSHSAKIVIGAIFGLGLTIYVVDLLIRFTLSGMGNLVHLVGA